jgi:hypothetical protein
MRSVAARVPQALKRVSAFLPSAGVTMPPA